MCLSKDRQLNQYWKKVALTACFYVRAATMDYHASSCPCQLPNLLFKKKKMWYLKLQYLIPLAFCLSLERLTTTLSTKVLKEGLSKCNFPWHTVSSSSLCLGKIQDLVTLQTSKWQNPLQTVPPLWGSKGHRHSFRGFFLLQSVLAT